MTKNMVFPELKHPKNLNILVSFLVLHSIVENALSDICVREYFPDKNETVTVNRYQDRPAQESPSPWSLPIPDDGVEGWLLYAEPDDACGPLKPPLKTTVNKKPWIVMARRFNCTFGEKASNAEAAGYSAIIIHNMNSDEPMSMGGGDHVVNIPVVSIGESSAVDLLRYQYNKKSPAAPLYTILITSDWDLGWLEKYLWPFFGVVTGCFCCMGIYIVVKWGLERRRQRRIASRRRLSTKQLNRIPTKKYKKGDSYEVCAICLEDYEENEKLRILPCNHAYHTKCVDPWLTKSRKFCPVCKRKILTKKEREKQRKKEEEREQEESLRRALAAAETRQEEEEEEEEQEEEEQADSSGGESSEEESEERESEEAQPLIQDPPLTVVDRLRRFFRRRQTIEVEVDDSETQPPLRDNQFRSSYGSLNNVDPINSQIEAAENHLQQHMQHAGGLNENSGDSEHMRRHFQNHTDEHLRQMPTVVAVHATVHMDHRPPQSDLEGNQQPSDVV